MKFLSSVAMINVVAVTEICRAGHHGLLPAEARVFPILVEGHQLIDLHPKCQVRDFLDGKKMDSLLHRVIRGLGTSREKHQLWSLLILELWWNRWMKIN